MASNANGWRPPLPLSNAGEERFRSGEVVKVLPRATVPCLGVAGDPAGFLALGEVQQLMTVLPGTHP